MNQASANVVADLQRRCAAGGLDLAAPLQAGWYNATVAPAHRIEDFGDPASLVVVIGNTRLLWRKLLAALAAQPALLADSDPLDRYVEQLLRDALADAGTDFRVRFAHRPEPQHIGMQRLAEVAGLAWRSPAMLSVHPRYGPWIGLRAAVTLPLPWRAARPRPAPECTACAGGCLPRLGASALADWRAQLAVRDACPVGRQYRYSDTQIAYHYTKSRDLLRAAVRGAPASE